MGCLENWLLKSCKVQRKTTLSTFNRVVVYSLFLSLSQGIYICIFNLCYLFILLLAMLGLRGCMLAFSSHSEQGLLFIAVGRLLTVMAFLAVEHRLSAHGISSCLTWA